MYVYIYIVCILCTAHGYDVVQILHIYIRIKTFTQIVKKETIQILKSLNGLKETKLKLYSLHY